MSLSRNAGKRLLTNSEWRVAAFGTPDPGATGDGVTTCNTAAAGLMATGSARSCLSGVGVFDMIGNLWEWVADWIQGDTNPWVPITERTTSTACGNDLMSGTNPAQTQRNCRWCVLLRFCLPTLLWRNELSDRAFRWQCSGGLTTFFSAAGETTGGNG